jgi:diaminohydroxyphosphoribosylaminopyrimidine deaminase/5-amino-6-(5-phosphoribosylamino)uracil reductase
MAPFSAIDYAHMARALRLAELGLHTTQPNPRVGCVLAHGDEIVGDGWHQRAGEAHAEVLALRAAGERARGATVYVTLEPCAHFGKTPPCADALIAAGVARVVVASDDPFHKVDGRGLEKLRAAGIAVETGLLREPARDLNRGFFSRVERRRPWVRVKLATSLDGRTALANGQSKWITGAAARADVQHWRARSSAILTGSGTVLADNPSLTLRLAAAEAEPRVFASEPSSGASRDFMPRGEGKSFKPLRVVLDGALRTPLDSNVLDGSCPTLVLHSPDKRPADERYARVELAAVASVDGRLDPGEVLRMLAERSVNELQVEAGPTLCGSLFAAGFVDEFLLYVAPVMLGDQARPLLNLPVLDSMQAARRMRVLDQRQVGADLRFLLRE